jgi:hypothetical protein
MRAPVDWRDTGREPREEWRARLPAGCTCRNCGRPWDATEARELLDVGYRGRSDLRREPVSASEASSLAAQAHPLRSQGSDLLEAHFTGDLNL